MACDPSPLATRRPTSSSARRSCSTLVKHAESRGFEVSGVSDHLQPWRHNGGHAPAVLPWLGAAAASTTKIVARHECADADDALPPGDRRAGVRDARVPGAGPDLPRRRHRRGDERDADHRRRVPRPQGAADEDGRGDHGDASCSGPRSGWTSRASTTTCGAPRSTTGPDEQVPIYVAASGPLAAKLAGRVGDGFICTSGKDPQLYVDLLANVKEGAEKAGRDPEQIKRMIEVKVSYDRDPVVGREGDALVGGAGAHARGEGGRRGPGRDGAPRRQRGRPRAHALHRLGRPAGGRGQDPAVHRARLRRAGVPLPGQRPEALHRRVRQRRLPTAA